MAKKTNSGSRRVQAPKSNNSQGYGKRHDRRLFWTRVVAALTILGLLLAVFGALLTAGL